MTQTKSKRFTKHSMKAMMGQANELPRTHLVVFSSIVCLHPKQRIEIISTHRTTKISIFTSYGLMLFYLPPAYGVPPPQPTQTMPPVGRAEIGRVGFCHNSNGNNVPCVLLSCDSCSCLWKGIASGKYHKHCSYCWGWLIQIHASPLVLPSRGEQQHTRGVPVVALSPNTTPPTN